MALAWRRVPGARPSPGRPSLLVAFCGTSGSCLSPLTISVLVLSLHASGSGEPQASPGVGTRGSHWLFLGFCAWSCRIERSGGEATPVFVFAYVLPLVVFFLVDPRLFSFHHRKEDVGTVRGFVCVVFFCVTMLLGGTRVLFWLPGFNWNDWFQMVSTAFSDLSRRCCWECCFRILGKVYVPVVTFALSRLRWF